MKTIKFSSFESLRWFATAVGSRVSPNRATSNPTRVYHGADDLGKNFVTHVVSEEPVLLSPTWPSSQLLLAPSYEAAASQVDRGADDLITCSRALSSC